LTKISIFDQKFQFSTFSTLYQRAAQIVSNELARLNRPLKIVDMRGGLYAWNRDIDSTFPLY